MTVSAAGPTTDSFLTVYPGGTSNPGTTSVSLVQSQDVTTLVQSQVGSGGTVNVYNNTGNVTIAVDVEGYYSIDSSNGSASYRPVNPSTTIYDTRQSGNSKLGPGETRVINVEDHFGSTTSLVPPTTTAVAITVTVANSTANSFLEEYPANQPAPNPATSFINTSTSSGAAPDNLVLAKVSPSGTIDLYNNAGYTDVIIALDGYYLDQSTANAPTGLNPQANGTLFDAPDPSSVQTSSTTSQIYATGTSINTEQIFTEGWTTGTTQTINPQNALNLSPGINRGDAPSVMLINGQYVIWFSGNNSNLDSNCLEAATSSSASQPFSVVTPSGQGWCDQRQSQGEGLFDPSIFRDVSGNLWLLYAEEAAATGSASASIHVVPLNAAGTSIVGNTDYVIANQSDVANALSVTIGSNPEIENPQMDVDYSYGYAPGYGAVQYDLYLSYGSYNDANAYHTVEIACVQVTGPCFDRNPALQDNSLLSGESQSLMNPGGMALAYGGPIGEYALFAAQLSGDVPVKQGGKRGIFYENASSVVGDYGNPVSQPTANTDSNVPVVKTL